MIEEIKMLKEFYKKERHCTSLYKKHMEREGYGL
jgi:hypothetical protein